MSDLCHNCGDCHLGTHPSPCTRDLQHCQICNNLGHTYNFCPTSVCRLEKDYKYWMLCHNCDVWHLPAPCQNELVQCPHCHHRGHLPFFCPLSPQGRVRPLGGREGGTNAAKRRRDQDVGSELHGPVVHVNQVHSALVHQIKLEAAKETLNMVEIHGKDAVQNHISRFNGPALPLIRTGTAPMSHGQRVMLPPHPPETNATWHAARQAGISGFTGIPQQSLYGNPYHRIDSQQLVNSQRPVISSPSMMSPAPTSAAKPPPPANSEHQEETTHQNRRNGLAHGAMSQVLETPQNIGTTDTPAERMIAAAGSPTPTSSTVRLKSSSGRQGGNPGYRCTACKKAHKRCPHNPDGSFKSQTFAYPESFKMVVEAAPPSLVVKLPVPTSFLVDLANHGLQSDQSSTDQNALMMSVEQTSPSLSMMAGVAQTQAASQQHHHHGDNDWEQNAAAATIAALTSFSQSQSAFPDFPNGMPGSPSVTRNSVDPVAEHPLHATLTADGGAAPDSYAQHGYAPISDEQMQDVFTFNDNGLIVDSPDMPGQANDDNSQPLEPGEGRQDSVAASDDDGTNVPQEEKKKKGGPRKP